MLKKDTKIEKAMVYVFEGKSLAVMIPIGEKIIEEDKALDTLILEISKEGYSNLNEELRKSLNDDIEEVRELLREEESYSFTSLLYIESSNLENDRKQLKYIKDNYKKLNQLEDDKIELINIGCFKESKHRFNLINFEESKEHNLLIIDADSYYINDLLQDIKKNEINLSENLKDVQKKDILNILENGEKIFISLAIDIFTGRLIADEIRLGNFKSFTGSCNYDEFNRFGICIEVLNKKIIISAGDFDGKKIHLENLNEITDFKYILMSYVDKFIKNNKIA